MFKIEKIKPLLPFVIIIILTALFYSPLVKHINNISLDDDWLAVYFHHYFIRDSILSYGQLPFWSPYICGGYPIAQYPEFPLCSPLITSSLFFGEVAGTKVNILFFYLAGALGMYYLAKNILGYSVLSAMYSSLILTFSSWLPWAAKDGNYIEMYYFLFPLMLGLMLKAFKTGRKKYLIFFAFVLSLVIFDGNVAFLAIILFLMIYAFMECFKISRKRLKLDFLTMILLGGGALLAVLIAMVKAAPMAQLLLYNSRGIDDYASASSLAYTFRGLSGSLTRSAPLLKMPFPEPRIFIGIIPLLMSFGYLIVKPLKSFKWAAALAIAVLLAMGSNAFIDLFKLLWRLPLYHSMHKPAKYYDFFIIFNIAILSGGFLNHLLRLKRFKKEASLAVFLIMAVSLTVLYAKNVKTNSQVFIGKKPLLEKKEEFYQIKGLGLKRYSARTPKSNFYFNILRNIGTIDWKTNIKLGEFAEPKYFVDKEDNLTPNSSYKGEVFFTKGENTAFLRYFSPNKIIIDIEVVSSDRLIVNQNFHKNWQAGEFKVINNQGLIGVDIKQPGKYAVALRYRDKGAVVGGVVSILTIFLLFGLLLIDKFKRKLPVK